MRNWLDDEFLYNPGTDLLLNWGDHLLERPKLKMEHEDLIEMLSTWKKSALLKDAEQGLPLLLRDAEEGRLFLINNPIIPATEADESWHKTIQVLDSFDHVLFFWTAAADILWEEFQEFVKKLEGVYLQLSDWIDQGADFSTLRLVPLNDWRRRRLNEIPEEQHYLYPWYSSLNEIQTDAIDLIAENWPSIQQEGYKALSFIAEDNRSLVWIHLKADRSLQSAFAKQKEIENILFEVIDQSLALRLLHLSSTHAQIRVVPEKFASVGLARIANTVLADSTVEDDSPVGFSNALERAIRKGTDMDKILLSAFCGPYLSNEERLSAFKWVEAQMNKKDFPLGGPNGLFTKLELWWKHEIVDEKIIEVLFLCWDSYRKRALDLLESDEFEERKTEIIQKLIGIGIMLEIGSMICRRPRIYSKPYLSSSEGEENIALSFDDGNIIFLPIIFDKENKLPYLDPVETNKKMKAVGKLLRDAVSFTGGWYKRTGEDVQKIEMKPCIEIETLRSYSLPKDKYEYVFIAIATNHKILQKALEGKKLEPNEKKQVILVVYDPALLSVGELKEASILANKLRNVEDPVSQYLRDHFSEQTKRLLDSYDEATPVSEEIRRALIDEFNQMMVNESLYDVKRFKGVELSMETQELISQEKAQFKKTIRLNRLLLEDAYPNEIEKSFVLNSQED